MKHFLCYLIITWLSLSLISACQAQVAPASSGCDNSLHALTTEASNRLARQFPFLAKVPRVRASSGDYVILVHGFSWAKPPLRTLGRNLHKEGFHTIEIHYPIRSISMLEVVQDYILPAVKEHCTDPERRIHFVGHSMGCIMIRKLLKEHAFDQLGRVVLLAAPNKGTEIADIFSKTPVIGKMLGEAVEQVGTEPESVPNQLGPVDYSPGIIMGTRSDFPIFPEIIPGDDDGVVRVDSGPVDGMAELITLPTTHIRMPSTRIACAQTSHFLRTGKFTSIPYPARTTWLTF
ncbi:MAG: triacylglycerol lipase [Verrucomicrobiales bacterium]|jgi:triacylglycerol lipase